MRRFVIGFFFLLAALIFRPILANVWYPMHDNTQITRTYLLGVTLGSGQIPAVWSHELNGGLGYPLFHFYAPLYYYISLALSLLTNSYFYGLKLALFLITVLGMSGVYLLSRRWGRGAGLLSAAAYALLPYAAVNLYVRGAFAEYLAMGLLPWVFYVWRDLSTRTRQLAVGAITALFILSHNLIPLLTVPFLLIWILLHHHSVLKRLAIPALVTLGISAFFLLPLLFERHFVQADTVAQTTSYSLHFVAPTQLWNSLWGYGGSAAGIEDGMSFKIGKLHLLLALVGFVLALRRGRKVQLYLGLAALLALFMTTQYSALIWDHLPLLPLIQFPWRFLSIAGLFISLLAGYSATIFRHQYLQLLYALGAISFLLILNLKLFTPQTTFPAELTQFTSPAFLATIPSIIPEFMPAWVAQPNPAPVDATILPYLYYPTWVVRLEGKIVPTFPSTTGLLAFINPTHSTDLVATQSHTSLENFSNYLTLISLIIVAYFFWRSRHDQV